MISKQKMFSSHAVSYLLRPDPLNKRGKTDSNIVLPLKMPQSRLQTGYCLVTERSGVS